MEMQSRKMVREEKKERKLEDLDLEKNFNFSLS